MEGYTPFRVRISFRECFLHISPCIHFSVRMKRFQRKPFQGGAASVDTATGGVSDQLLKNARKSGQLNLSSRGLTEGKWLC